MTSNSVVGASDSVPATFEVSSKPISGSSQITASMLAAGLAAVGFTEAMLEHFFIAAAKAKSPEAEGM